MAKLLINAGARKDIRDLLRQTFTDKAQVTKTQAVELEQAPGPESSMRYSFLFFLALFTYTRQL